MTNIPLVPGVAGFEASDTFVTTELFNSAIPHPVTEDFPVAADVVLEQFAVVGIGADGNLAMGTYGFQPAKAATGALTFSGVGTVDDTITIGSVTYTLKAAPTTVANQVKIGATAAETAANLIAAVNKAAGGGSAYGSSTLVHPDVQAESLGGAVVGVTAKVPGLAGNAIATTEVGTNTSFGAVTLTGGEDLQGVQPIGVTTAPVADVDAAQRVAIYRAGNFNPDALKWHASFDSDAKKLAAFRGAPAPTNIVVRKRL